MLAASAVAWVDVCHYAGRLGPLVGCARGYRVHSAAGSTLQSTETGVLPCASASWLLTSVLAAVAPASSASLFFGLVSFADRTSTMLVSRVEDKTQEAALKT